MNRRSLAIALAATIGGVALSTSARADANSDVAARIEALRKLMLTPNQAALNEIFADELTYGHSDRRVMNKAEIIASLVEGRSHFDSITISEQTIQIVGDLAIVRHRFVADAVSNGKPGHPDLRLLMVWQNRGGAWRLLVRQAH